MLPPIAQVLASLIAKPVSQATMQMGSLAGLVDKSIASASALSQIRPIDISPPMSQAPRRRQPAQAEPLPTNPKEMLSYAARQILPRVLGVTQRVQSSIQMALNLPPTMRPVDRPLASAVPTMNLAAMLGNDPISRAMADDFHNAELQKADAQQEEAKKKAKDGTEQMAEAAIEAATKTHALAGGLLAAGYAAYKFSTYTLESRRHLAEYSGSIASDFAALDLQQLMLDLRTANQTEGSTKELARAVGDMRAGFQPILADVTNMQNTLATLSARVLPAVAKLLWFTSALPVLAEIAKFFEDEKKKEKLTEMQTNSWLQGTARGEFVQELPPLRKKP